jgi:hypothetical protein
MVQLSVSGLDKAVSGVFKNQMLTMSVRVLLVIIILSMSYISRGVLSIFENGIFQLFYLVLMAYVVLLDAPSGLLMATIYLFAVQQLNKPENKSENKPVKMTSSNNLFNHNALKDNFNNVQLNELVAMAKSNFKLGEGFADVPSMQSVLTPTNSPSMAYTLNLNKQLDAQTQPAFKTMTENLDESTLFTTKAQFENAQSHNVPGVDQTGSVKSLQNQLSAQGIDLPHGYDREEYILGSSF